MTSVSPDREKIVARARKLKALADRPGTQGEGDAARARLSALLRSHGMTERDLEEGQQQRRTYGDRRDGWGGRQSWEEYVRSFGDFKARADRAARDRARPSWEHWSSDVDPRNPPLNADVFVGGPFDRWKVDGIARNSLEIVLPHDGERHVYLRVHTPVGWQWHYQGVRKL